MLIQYGSLSKYLNLFKACLSYLKGTTHLSTMPSFLKVEISRKCTVKCRYCDLVADKQERYYPIEDFKSLLQALKPFIFEVSLYDIGEPLENPDIIDYIKYAKARSVGTIISTTLSIKKPGDFWEELILSGLDHLIVAIDGITEETYRKYRTHGNLGLVLSNLAKILYLRGHHNSGLLIEWQMLDLPWNKEEQTPAKKMAMNIGCNKFRIVKEMVLQRLEYNKSKVERRRNCLLPYLVFIVNAYKQVRSCYKIYHEDMVVGDIERESFQDIWNGEKIKRIRDKSEIRRRAGCRSCKE